MWKFSWIMVYVAAMLLATGCAYAGCGKKDSNMTANSAKPCCLKGGDKVALTETEPVGRPDVIYACDCGGGCECNTLSKTSGKCACGKELRWHHVVRVEGDEALLCSCGEGCQCALSKTDLATCACGNPVKRVSLKNSGLFFCNCGGSCSCNNVSNKPGECRCGMQLKQST